MKQKTIYILVFLLVIDVIFLCTLTVSYAKDTLTEENNENITTKITNNIVKEKEEILELLEDKNTKKITINAVGDCTIGYDDSFGYNSSFNEYKDKYGYEYFFSNVKDIFNTDDLTIANLETTFTESNIKKEKKFNFKAPLDYANILTTSSIEMVNIANNHIYDYNEVGYNDTINTLKNNNIKYFGFDNYYIYEKESIKIGFAGIFCIESKCTKEVDKAIKYFNDNNISTIIMSFHWGIEKDYKQSEIQTSLAHYAIDNGVELVLGHHPHVLQGIEVYKGKYIVYSLGNFSFGGNKNPTDKDSMIFNIEFYYENNNLINKIVNIIPVSISSVNNINDYRPTILTNDEHTRVLKKIEKYSIGITLT